MADSDHNAMDQAGDAHVLHQLAAGALDAVNQLQQDEPDLWVLTGFAANLSQALLASAMHLDDLGPNDTLPLILWQQMTKYQFQALLHFVTRDLDCGYTLLRNAAELVRDVAHLGSNPMSADAWWKARSTGRSDRRFRFNRSDPLQAYVHDIYKGASNWGTHGHITGLSGSQPSGVAGLGDRIQVRQVTDASREQALGIWLLGFAPMQHVCATVFQNRASSDFSAFLVTLASQGEILGTAATRLRARSSETA
jgi:DNA polymerase III psi subunit